jgi:hypothetical protein
MLPGFTGRKHTQETRYKMRENHRKFNSPIHNQRISQSLSGRTLSPDHIQHLKESKQRARINKMWPHIEAIALVNRNAGIYFANNAIGIMDNP